MPRFSRRQPFQQELFGRHLGEIRDLLDALELRDVFGEGENRPPVDMYETCNEIVLEFDLPGFRIEDISLTQHGATLVLEAHRPCEQAVGDAHYVCLERGYGRFHHALHIPGCIDTCAIKAEYRYGVLRVRYPKTGDRQVTIKEIQD
ncbi:Hsp20/alpha crystallin family protein [Oryzomonas rubra]|uniref:Hsp20/alpha crystallin family protein n=1 Tax=Oryzomonas rubra TaxID=2509454 RepID=A0A5A9XJM8_9BACT|nr:Hsp20/alpha crystallin family protein [Oryzomonas rubra]KAA0893367.1 Hsp20/alpha crystallin family protein [Oryzomonas rubra]